MSNMRHEPLGISRTSVSASGVNTADRLMLGMLGRTLAAVPVRLELWDGSAAGRERGPGVTGIRIRDRGALWRLLTDPELQFGDLYSSGRIRVDGDLVSFIEQINRRKRGGELMRGLREAALRVVRAAPDLEQARRNIHHHYDIGNDFYQLWLDREALQYTCAYFASPEMSLEQAQQAKMHHVCRKAWLKPGVTVIEAGFGWGGLALFMAREYGVNVRAFNISSEQVAYAREWAKREGLADKVEFVLDDYRNAVGKVDAFISVGMLEHVGPGNYRELGRVIDRCLKPDGRGVIHSIGRDRVQPLNPWIKKRIFPGAYPPTLREMAEILEPAGLSILDVENLRLHYSRTLRGWLENYEANLDLVRDMFDDAFVRAWRLYLAGSIAAFNTGTLQLFQVAFARSGRNAIPWTRADLYRQQD